MNESVISRYSVAFVSALSKTDYTDYQSAVEIFLEGLKEEGQLHDFLNSAFIEKKDKRAALLIAAAPLNLPLLNNFMEIIFDNNREGLLLEILRDFLTQVALASGSKKGIVYSSVVLDKAKIAELEKALTEKFGFNVILQNKVESSLLGGIKVSIGDTVIDDTIKNRLDLLKSQLLRK